MKKIVAFLLTLVMVTVLVSCGGIDSTGEKEQPEAKELEIFTKIFYQAMEAYSWFHLTTMPIDSTDSKEADGMTFYRVSHDTINTYADLEVYLRSLFSGNLVDELLNSRRDLYREFDGKLYGIPADRGSDITKGEYELSIDRVSNTKVKFVVEVELLDPNDLETVTGYETHEYNLELIDNNWIFKNFDLFY